MDLSSYTNNELREELSRRLKERDKAWEDTVKCRVCKLGYHDSNHWDCDDYQFPGETSRPGQYLDCSGDHYWVSYSDSSKEGRGDYPFPHHIWKCKYCGLVFKVQRMLIDPSKPLGLQWQMLPGEVVFDNGLPRESVGH